MQKSIKDGSTVYAWLGAQTANDHEPAPARSHRSFFW